jgi:hypothetical protein
MADDCLPQIFACVARITDLDANGVPTPGDNHMYVSNALTTITLKPVYKDGVTIEEDNGCGELAVSYQGDPSYKWDEVEIEFLKREPRLEAMLSRGHVLDLGGGAPLGSAGPKVGVVTGRVSLEFWAKRINGPDVDPDFPFAWWALPKVRNLKRNDDTFGASAQKPKFTGIAVENPNWFDGPTNDWPAASDRCVQWVPTTTIPDAHCGALPVAVS